MHEEAEAQILHAVTDVLVGAGHSAGGPGQAGSECTSGPGPYPPPHFPNLTPALLGSL